MRVLPAVAIGFLSAATALSAQPTRTQEYEAVSQPEQLDSTTQAQNVRMREDGYERMTVPVRISGRGPYRFLIDTGADRTAISRDLAAMLQLAKADKAILHSMTGISEVGTANVPVLDLAAKQLRNVDAALLERGNMGADGILGLDSLHSEKILFDFKKETLTIIPSTANVPELRDSIVVTGRIRNGRLVLADASADGTRLTICVDTGAQVSIGNEVLRKRLSRHDVKRMGNVQLVSVTGETLMGQYTIVRKLEVGGVTLKDLPVVFTESHAFGRLGLEGKPALLLGMNALRGFDRVSIDFAKRKLRVVLPEEGALDRSAFASL
ncbi:MAG TPA: aspartyl protease family protein [Sphingomicrobium sp.]